MAGIDTLGSDLIHSLEFGVHFIHQNEWGEARRAASGPRYPQPRPDKWCRIASI